MTVWHSEGLFDGVADFEDLPSGGAPAEPAAPPPPLITADYVVAVRVVAHYAEPVPNEPSFLPPAEALEKYLRSALRVAATAGPVHDYELVELHVVGGPEEV